MIEGKEPMRTFGDLMQFIKVKQGGEPAGPQREAKDAAPGLNVAASGGDQGKASAAETVSTPPAAVPEKAPADTIQPASVAAVSPSRAANGEPASESTAEPQASHPAAP
jgi:hypothetical protein